ncbi:MAG: Holliday junction helicase subunit RuvA [Acidimicrobiales bacterium]|jgi:Holliday junction DNA helicase RuvA|nr:Holliday junction helicase subunit RuvA [Acidimicrobiales bacterium]
MIGSLRGTLLDRAVRGAAAEVVVEVAGVGYRALVAPRTLAELGQLGDQVFLWTHQHMREDAVCLYAFGGRDERDCFEALIGAHGVGPALALAILAVHTPSALRRALVDGDADALTLVPGVGKKTAARLLIELQSRLDVLDGPDLSIVVTGDGSGPPPARADLRAALAGLGYEADEVRHVLRELPDDGDLDTLLRDALRLLAVATR